MSTPAHVLWDGQVPVGDGGTRRHRVIRTHPTGVTVEGMRTDALGGESWYPIPNDSTVGACALVCVINAMTKPPVATTAAHTGNTVAAVAAVHAAMTKPSSKKATT